MQKVTNNARPFKRKLGGTVQHEQKRVIMYNISHCLSFIVQNSYYKQLYWTTYSRGSDIHCIYSGEANQIKHATKTLQKTNHQSGKVPQE